MSFSETQLKAMALTPKVAAALSIPGSAWILYQTYLDARQQSTQSRSFRRGGDSLNHRGRSRTITTRTTATTTPMQRALAGMSVVDLFSSLAWFTSTWAAPHPESGALYAAGNTATCRAQGVLLQVAIGAPMYNAALILFFLLTIKYQWTHADLQRRLEPALHAFIWIWCIGTSVWVGAMDLLHFIGPVCWISDPPECWLDEIPEHVECGRAKRYSTFTFCVPLWITILLTIFALVEIYRTVRSTVRKMEQCTTAPGGERVNVLRKSAREVRAVSLRAVLYSVAFILTWTTSTIWSVAQWFECYPFWVSYMWTLFEPLQGFWNLCIFLHNRPDSREKLTKALQSTTSWISRSSSDGKTEGGPGTIRTHDSSTHRESQTNREITNENEDNRNGAEPVMSDKEDEAEEMTEEEVCGVDSYNPSATPGRQLHDPSGSLSFSSLPDPKKSSWNCEGAKNSKASKRDSKCVVNFKFDADYFEPESTKV